MYAWAWTCFVWIINVYFWKKRPWKRVRESDVASFDWHQLFSSLPLSPWVCLLSLFLCFVLFIFSVYSTCNRISDYLLNVQSNESSITLHIEIEPCKLFIQFIIHSLACSHIARLEALQAVAHQRWNGSKLWADFIIPNQYCPSRCR